VANAFGAVLVVPAVLATALWPRLPGSPTSLGGALLRGVIVAVVLWIIGGLLLPAFAALDRFDAGAPGVFAASAGLGTAAVFLVAHLGYGIVLATLCYLAQGLEPIDAFGWIGVGKRGPRHEPTG
jgi:hypothetical protein